MTILKSNRRLLSTLAALMIVAPLQVARAGELPIEPIGIARPGQILSGALVMPEGQTPTVAVVLVPGMASQKRALQLAQALAAQGAAVLTYDSRPSASGSRGLPQGFDLNRLAADASAALAQLKRHEGWPASRRATSDSTPTARSRPSRRASPCGRTSFSKGARPVPMRRMPPARRPSNG